MDKENINIMELVLDTLNKDDLWFTQKTDPTYQEASSYYELDEFGDPTEKTIKKIEKEVNSLIGDGAVDIIDAIELWKNDQIAEFRLDFRDNLVTKFEPKPVVDNIKAYENSVQFPQSKKIEAKIKKTENIINLSDDDKQKYYIGKGIVGGQATPYDLYKIDNKYYNANGLEISEKDALDDMDNFKHIFGDKKTEDYDVDTYNKEQAELKREYRDRIVKSITPEIKNAFNDLRDLLDDGEDKTELDGFYFPSDAITVVDMADKAYHLNSAMDLTTSNILNMVGNNDTIEQAIDELFADYDAESAYSWADNFITVLGKLDFDLHNDGENDVYTFEVSLPDCDPLMFTADWSEEAAVKEYMENEGSMSKYTVDDISINYLDEPIPINENKKVEDYDDYVSIYDEIDDMLDYLVTDDKTKLELYNHFNSSSPLENLEGENEDVYDEWLFEFKLDNARKLKRYLNKLDDINSLEDSKCFDESKSFGRALRELKTEAKQDKTELTPEQKANKIANIGSLVGRAKYPFQLNAVVHTLSFVDQDLSNKLRQTFNPATIKQDGIEDARNGIAQMIFDETGVDVLAPNMEFATESKNVNFNNCTKDKVIEAITDNFYSAFDSHGFRRKINKDTTIEELMDELHNFIEFENISKDDTRKAIKDVVSHLNIQLKANLDELSIYLWYINGNYGGTYEKVRKNKITENYQRRLEEVNNKSVNTIKDILQSDGFDSESNAGKIVLRTQDLFTALSDLGLDVDVTFDNGDSTSTVQLGTVGGKVVITINDPEKPLKAFMSGNVELTGDSLDKFKAIEDRIKTI